MPRRIWSSKGVQLKIKTYSTKSKRSRTDIISFNPSSQSTGKKMLDTNAKQCNDYAAFSESINLKGDNFEELSETEQPHSSYAKRKETETQQWRNVREEMLRCGIDHHKPLSSSCCVCSCLIEKHIRCTDCGPFAILCEDCEVSVHKGRLHKPDVWQVCVYLIRAIYL